MNAVLAKNGIRRIRRDASVLAVMAAALAFSGCATLVSSAASGIAEDLSGAILDQNDPETVRAGAPAFLLLLDGFVRGSPDNSDVLQAAATLYSAYGAVFAEDPVRAKRLTQRARDYGQRGLCASHRKSCGLAELEYDAYVAALNKLKPAQAGPLYAYTVSWLVWIRAHSDDWGALADLPKVEAALNRMQTLDPNYQAGSVNLYLGVLNTLRPPALGGDPETGRAYFEKSIELGGGRDLGAKVEFARNYARMLYDRDLHDRLLNEVIEADPEAPGLTLMNVIAQQQARDLLAAADDYF